jgi:hypothetical protein
MANTVTNRRLESALQARIIARCKTNGVFARKVTSPGRKGFPDVFIVDQRAKKFGGDGPCLLVEVKRFVIYRPDGLQSLTHRELRRAGATVLTLRGQAEVELFLMRLIGEWTK